MRTPDRFALLVLAALVAASPARAQDDKAEELFDDEPKAKAEAKPADATKPEAAKPAEAKKDDLPDRDKISFTQQNVASQMTELEGRMFRLSEALRTLEPENASRLRLALKFSREELILQQMKDTQALLQEAQINKAETEAKELLAKLEHLRNLLLAENLDFQLKLARLRQMRETTGQLERIIAEEKRELAWSRNAVEQQEKVKAMQERRAKLEALIKEQEKVLADTEAAGKQEEAARAAAKAPVREQEQGVQKTAAALAADPGFSDEPAFLKQADPHLGDALTHLATPDTGAAVASEGQALDLFRNELAKLDEQLAAANKATVPAEFAKFEQEQARNRNATDTLGVVSARLGDSGVALQKDLIRASSSMRDAEGDLNKAAAEPAATDQTEALKHLAKGNDALGQATEKLLVELRTELQARIIAELTEMHAIQQSIRETTEAQAARAAQKSRAALITLANQAKQEAAMAERIEQLKLLVEETEFGIALPTALGVLGRQMRVVETWLNEGDATARTVTLEKRIEEDLLALLQAMRRLPPTTPPKPGTPMPSDPRDRERELNRLIAELKMIRLLQVRLNDDTLGVDGTRPEQPPLSPELRKQIESLKANQSEIRDSLKKIGVRVEGPEGGSPLEPGQVDR